MCQKTRRTGCVGLRRWRGGQMEYRLGEYIVGCAVRRLAGDLGKAEGKPVVFNGTVGLVSVFGVRQRIEIPTRFLLKRDEKDIRCEEGHLNWQSLADLGAGRAKFRLSFESNALTCRGRSGDDIWFLIQPDGCSIVVLAEEGSSMNSQLRWLFDVKAAKGIGFSARRFGKGRSETSISERLVLEELGAA